MLSDGINVDSALQQFGLSDVEVAVYKAGLQLGSRPASVIAEKAGLKRSHTYSILSHLEKKGIVQEVEKNKIRHFNFNPPDTLLSILENRQDELDAQREQIGKILPFLKQLSDNAAVKPKMRFFRGIDGVKEVYADMLESADGEILGFLDLKNSAIVGDKWTEHWIKSFIEKREEKNIRWRGFSANSDIARITYASRPSKLRKTKLIDDIDLWAEIHIYGNKLAVTSTYKEKIGVIIESEAIAKSIKNIFELLWVTLPGEVIEG